MQQPGLTVRYSADPEPVLHVAGELDMATAPALRDAFLRLAAQEEQADLVLDVSAVAFCDSSGLAVLLMGAKRWTAHGKRLILRRPSVALRRVLELAGATRAFTVED